LADSEGHEFSVSEFERMLKEIKEDIQKQLKAYQKNMVKN
jgi:hypothetical protein